MSGYALCKKNKLERQSVRVIVVINLLSFSFVNSPLCVIGYDNTPYGEKIKGTDRV